MNVAGTEASIVGRAEIGWLGLCVYVAAYDYYAIKHKRETLSGSFWRGLHHPVARFPVVLVATSAWKHLVLPNVLPKADPLMFLAERWHRSVQ